MKYKKIVILILLVILISLILTGVIVSKLMKTANGDNTKDRYWFFQQSLETGQPVTLENAYIISNEQNCLKFLYDYTVYEIKGTLEQEFSGVADIQIKGEKIVKISLKPQQAEGVIQAYDELTMTLKETGTKNRKSSVPIYRVSNGVVTQTEWNQLIVGVSKIHCVLENGVVCAVLLDEDVVPTDIRVVIKNDSDIFYSDLHIKKVSDGTMIHANAHMSENGVNSFTVTDEKGLVLCDAKGNALDEAYEGSLRVVKDSEGLVLVNELSMETYVKYVLPSEMPHTFEKEALKAQAVCARTYAYSHMKNQSYAKYGANLDDSTDFQAYHNAGRYEETDAAVEETKGEVVTCNGALISCYYYSTSPGVTNDMSSWEGENAGYISCMGLEFYGGLNLMDAADFSQFMTREPASYDAASDFYRWKAVLDISVVKESAKGELKSITVKQRNQSGYITQLELKYANTTETLKNENQIRKVLGNYLEEVVLQSEKVRTDLSMVPSACFEVLDVEEGKILLRGGGFGHGIGMSQYGAKGMAEAGHTYKEIIDYYYENVVVKKL